MQVVELGKAYVALPKSAHARAIFLCNPAKWYLCAKTVVVQSVVGLVCARVSHLNFAAYFCCAKPVQD